MKAKWENEKNAIGRVQQLRERIESLNREIEAAERRSSERQWTASPTR